MAKSVAQECVQLVTLQGLKHNWSAKRALLCRTVKMCDCLLTAVRSTLPVELLDSLAQELDHLQQARFIQIFGHPLTKLLLGHEENRFTRERKPEGFIDWNDFVFHRLIILLRSAGEESQSSAKYRLHFFLLLAFASLNAFLQSNATGPPLPFRVQTAIFPLDVQTDPKKLAKIKQGILDSLTVDGEAVYRLTPDIELLCLSDVILSNPTIRKHARWAHWVRLRADFVLQRTLSESSPTLQGSIYENTDRVYEDLASLQLSNDDVVAQFHLESAAIFLHYRNEKKAQEAVKLAAGKRKFDFTLTGFPGKRTKYQEKETSQLVVLARSNESIRKKVPHVNGDTWNGPDATAQPKSLNLDDDTLLESISFAHRGKISEQIGKPSSLPQSLASLDPNNQPRLEPADSIILLSLACSITNKSPADGLTREETLPYAIRVLNGGSSNWQIYTQALLVRSRIEGYRSRTAERGLLQLQALVDQVIAETSSNVSNPSEDSTTGLQQTTFLPRPKASESAHASERLIYVYQLCSPFRWEIEAELASRWISLGGLRSALDIYERLEMWAEAALCWAATDREEKAIAIVRKQLFYATSGNDEDANGEKETWQGRPREPPPTDAPRLYCILGDINQDPSMYEMAWEVSNGRYARSQRSLGRQAFAANDFINAADSYSKAVKIDQLNNRSWFALGCALLQLERFEQAVEAFVRTVQLDDSDAEAWSNLATALLSRGTNSVSDAQEKKDLDFEGSATTSKDSHRHKKDALKALQRAASLKNENPRIWDNLLTVAASLNPPAYTDIILAETRIIELRGSVEGESCIDANIISHLVRHVVSTYTPITESYESEQRATETGRVAAGPRPSSLPQLLINLMDNHIERLLTTSSALWRASAALSLWRNKTSSSLSAQEKAWRAAMTGANAGWESGTQGQWDQVVDATIDLVGAYESLGPREKTEGVAAGSGELVARDWRFKARSAVKGILGRGKDSWDMSEGWERLQQGLEGLKNPNR